MQIDSVRRADEAPAQTANPTFRSPVCDAAVLKEACPRERGSESFETSHEFVQDGSETNPENRELLRGLKRNFSDPNRRKSAKNRKNAKNGESAKSRKCAKGPLTAKNYAAELTRDCVSLLSLLGQKPDQNLETIDFAKCVTTGPKGAGGTRSVLSVNEEAQPGLERASELALRIRIRAGEAASRYKNGLPLKAALLLRQTLTAAMKEGLI